MNIIAVDDEKLALGSLNRVLEKVFPNANIWGFKSGREALEKVRQMTGKKENVDYAFLDVEMGGLTGIALAKRMKEIYPQVRILFVSAYNQYACEAFQIHAKGYILKPATEELIVEALDSMEVEWREQKEQSNVEEGKSVSVHTFGNFDVFQGKEAVSFERSKSKELFAYLIDRCGAGSSTAEIAAVLWDNMEDKKKIKSATQTVIHSMIQSLREHDLEKVIVKKWNYLAVDVSKIECDYYRFLEGDAIAVNAYMGEYMANYSWAEMTTASLLERQMVAKKN